MNASWLKSFADRAISRSKKHAEGQRSQCKLLKQARKNEGLVRKKTMKASNFYPVLSLSLYLSLSLSLSLYVSLALSLSVCLSLHLCMCLLSL